MLMLNHIALEALKRYRMPMARALISSVVTAKFNPGTATKRSLELFQQVMKLMNTARVAADSAGIGAANEAALMEDLGKLDPEKAAIKLAGLWDRFSTNWIQGSCEREILWSGERI